MRRSSSRAWAVSTTCASIRRCIYTEMHIAITRQRRYLFLQSDISMIDSETMANEKAWDYAWNWFQYHARQRITAFNLFLVLLGAIVAGYLKCAELAISSQASVDMINSRQIWWFLALAISIFGIMISIAFWFLDIRNAELVNCGRIALKDLEDSLGLTIRKDDESRKYLSKSLDILSRKIPQSWLPKLTRHGTWLRAIMIFAAITFFLAALYAAMEIYATGYSTMTTVEYPQNANGIIIFISN